MQFVGTMGRTSSCIAMSIPSGKGELCSTKSPLMMFGVIVSMSLVVCMCL